MYACSKSIDSRKRDGTGGRWQERRSIDSIKTQPSYFIYRLVGSQPGYAFEVSRAIVRHTREGKRRRRGEVRGPGEAGSESVRFSSAVQWFGERRKNASIGCASVQQQQRHKRRALLTRQPLFSSSLLPFSRAPDYARSSALFPRYDSFSLSLDGVSRERPAPLAVGRAIIQ